MTTALPQLVEQLWRHRHADLLAALVAALGPARIDLAEDVLQEAMVRALRLWPVEGVPERPDAWLFRVARNLAVDALRRRRVDARALAALQQRFDECVAPIAPRDGIEDDTLRMLFTCCHPSLPADTRVPLLLKTVCGLGVPAIAAALLGKEGTIAQRLVRGKARLQGGEVQFGVPGEMELPARLDTVLEVLYLLFNEGYRSHRGADLVQRDLVEEAVRLCGLLLERRATARPEVHALLALMLFLGARLPARVDADGELLTLREQDRSLWDQDWLRCAFGHFRASLSGDRMTAYHVEAAIASAHAVAVDYEATDWRLILREYDRLLRLHDSPVVRLNRVVALAKVDGCALALSELNRCARVGGLEGYPLLHATAAMLHWSLGDHAAAIASLQRAGELPLSEPERRLVERRLQACQRGEVAPRW